MEMEIGVWDSIVSVYKLTGVCIELGQWVNKGYTIFDHQVQVIIITI